MHAVLLYDSNTIRSTSPMETGSLKVMWRLAFSLNTVFPESEFVSGLKP